MVPSHHSPPSLFNPLVLACQAPPAGTFLLVFLLLDMYPLSSFGHGSLCLCFGLQCYYVPFPKVFLLNILILFVGSLYGLTTDML